MKRKADWHTHCCYCSLTSAFNQRTASDNMSRWGDAAFALSEKGFPHYCPSRTSSEDSFKLLQQLYMHTWIKINFSTREISIDWKSQGNEPKSVSSQHNNQISNSFFILLYNFLGSVRLPDDISLLFINRLISL